MIDRGRADEMIAANKKLFGPKSCCHKCWLEFLDGEKKAEERGVSVSIISNPFILCPTCGNKRCPKASDHDLACTGSNKSGQPGSIFK